MERPTTSGKKVILAFVTWYLPGHKAGGPIKTLSNLIGATHDSYDFFVVTRDRDLGDGQAYGGIEPDSWNDIGAARVFYTAPGWRGLKQIVSLMRSTPFDLLYLNTLYFVRFSLLPLAINRRLKKPVIIGARGVFSRGALGIKSFKKRCFLTFVKWLKIPQKVTWQASSDHEREDIQRVFGEHVNIEVTPNITSREYVSELPPKRSERLRVVLLARISPMKNIEFALETVRQATVPIEFDIYGPVESEEYWSRCQRLLANLPPHVTVNARGQVASADVLRTLVEYDLFFLPTRGENFGHVIAEALCAGLPLLIADTTPWRELSDQGIGWDLPLTDQAAFVARLDALHAMTVDEHHALRQRALAWARSRFDRGDDVNANRAMFARALESSDG